MNAIGLPLLRASHARAVRRRLGLALALLLLLGAPPLLGWWEASLVRHMLLQIPLLLLAGALVGPLLAPERPSGPGWQQLEGMAAVLAGLFCFAFWMLPRWLDAAVVDPWVDLGKMLSLPILGGLPLGWGWRRLRMVARGFVWAHVVAMFAVLGTHYLAWPERLCNNYLAGEQVALGHASLAVAALLGLGGALPALFGGPDAGNSEGMAASRHRFGLAEVVPQGKRWFSRR